MAIPGAQAYFIHPDEVHLWRIDLQALDVRRWQGLLTPDEKARAARFQVEGARRQFVGVRVALRQVLAACTGLAPDAIVLFANEYGKPMLPPESGNVQFNVSHAGDWGVIAVTRGRRVGVDVERLRFEVIGERIAEHFFAPEEVAVLEALPPLIQAEAFFNCWTRKEAFIKAVGRGLSLPLDAFVVTLAPGVEPALLETHWDPAEAARWSLTSLSFPSGYVGALAVEGDGWVLREHSDVPG